MSENLSLVDNRPSNDRIRVDYVLWFVVFFYLCLIGLEISSIWYGTVGYFFFILNSIPFLAVGRIICGIIWMRQWVAHWNVDDFSANCGDHGNGWSQYDWLYSRLGAVRVAVSLLFDKNQGC